MAEWKEHKLREFAEVQTGPFGSQLHASDYVEKGIPTIMPTNIGSRLNIVTDEIGYVSEEDVERLKRHKVREGDIVYSRRGDVEKCAYITENQDGWLCGTGSLRIRFVSDQIVPKFCAYYLSTDDAKYWILNSAVGTTMPNLNSKILGEFPLLIPTVDEQHAIASVLSSLDDKIDLLHGQNKTLEALAETLFRQWFVEEAEDGWEKGRLGNIGHFKNGINYSRDENGDTTYGIINVRDVMANKFLFRENVDDIGIDHEKAEPYLLKRFDIIIVRSASPGETTLILEDQEKLIYSGFTIRLRVHNTVNALFAFQFLQSFKSELDLFSDGTTLKNLNQDILTNIELRVPPHKRISAFNEKVQPMFDKISNNISQIRTLTQLRGTLLQKLMSGEVRVKENHG